MADPGNIETLRKEIEGAGAPDAYIDEEEERHIFARGDGLGVDRATVEAVLNQICRDNGWIREKDVVPDLHDQLDEATRRRRTMVSLTAGNSSTVSTTQSP